MPVRRSGRRRGDSENGEYYLNVPKKIGLKFYSNTARGRL